MSNAEQGQIVKREAQELAQSPTAAPLTAPPDEMYRLGFEGMATAAFAGPACEALREAIDPNDVEIKPDGIVFLPGVFYRSRLNRAFGPGAWAIVERSAPRRMPKGGGELVMFNGTLYVLGRFVSARIGECMYYPTNGGMTYADAYEGAITNCLARCCKDIMPGVEVLWDPGWRGEWQRKYAEQYTNDRTGKTEWRRKASLRSSKLSPNAILPIASPGAGAAVAAPTAVTGPSPSVPSAAPANASAPTASADDGEAASDAELDALEKLAFDELKIPHDFAGRWLFTTFGTRNPAALTKAQVQKAMELLPTVKVG